MTDTDPDRADLEQLLRDERALRHAAEARVADLTSQAGTWRSRAEERAERIERLLQAQDAPALRQWVQKMRRAWRNGETPGADDAPAPSAPGHIGLPGVRVAAAVETPELRTVVGTMDPVPIDAGGLAEADLVVVEPHAYAKLSQDRKTALGEWAAIAGRQPLVVWSQRDAPPPDLEALLRPGDLRLTTVAGDHTLPGAFDATIHRPGRHSAPTQAVTDVVARDGAQIHTGETGPIAVTSIAPLLDAPPLWLTELAAAGVAVSTGELPNDADLAALGAAARRWAYRDHAPWVRAEQLLAAAGVAAPSRRLRVAGILVSQRPDDLPAAIRGFLRQTYPDTELVVGVHGRPTVEIEKVLDEATIPVEMRVFEPALNLGACLNQAIEATSAPVLAKIDDDDHYGPAHLEDAVQALHYSGAPIVGKGAQFTYVAGADRTVLRRGRQEETYLNGYPTGASMVFRRSIWERVGFPHRPRRVDVLFIRGARRIGADVYANSRWEFCYVRHAGAHTWSTDDETFLAGSEPAWDGFHPERVEVADVVPPA